MKIKHLVSALQQLEGFDRPRIELEQYATPPEIAAEILQHIADKVDMEKCLVADLGTGTGVLLVGSALIGAKFVLGFDIDRDALAICRQNVAENGLSAYCDCVQMDLRASNIPSTLHGQFDVVITNPPFGANKNNRGADDAFVDAGLLLAKPAGGKLFSLHRTNTREYWLKRRKWPADVRPECVAQMRWNLDQTYGFHRRKSVDIAVDLFCIERI